MWQQTFAVAIGRPVADGSELEFFEAERQWADILAQMRLTVATHHVAGQEAQLTQEVSCLICFVGLLLEVIPKTVWFTYP
ncbi:hypothetical protein IFO70_27680 [Phormidium tenue FACHB-886]|nr:hypothetical protein [Phormidium tenue FACHB-886]